MSTRHRGSWDPRSAVPVVHCCGRSHGQPKRRILVAWTCVGNADVLFAHPVHVIGYAAPDGRPLRAPQAFRRRAGRRPGARGAPAARRDAAPGPGVGSATDSPAPDSVAARPNRCASPVVAVGPAPAASRCPTSERNVNDTSRNQHSLGCCSPYRPPPGPRRKPEARRPAWPALGSRALPGEQRRHWLPDCTRRSPLAALTGGAGSMIRGFGCSWSPSQPCATDTSNLGVGAGA
jgi:hypothetical protein